MGKTKENLIILGRGLRRRCPQCGASKLFVSWWQLEDSCANCGLKVAERESDTWAVMYLSTAFITGLFIVAMFLIFPKSLWLGRVLIGISALALFVLTAPFRKGLGVAFDYFIELRLNNDARLAFIPD